MSPAQFHELMELLNKILREIQPINQILILPRAVAFGAYL